MQRKQKSAVVLLFRLQISRFFLLNSLWEVRIVESSDAGMAQSGESADSRGLTADIVFYNTARVYTLDKLAQNPDCLAVQLLS